MVGEWPNSGRSCALNLAAASTTFSRGRVRPAAVCFAKLTWRSDRDTVAIKGTRTSPRWVLTMALLFIVGRDTAVRAYAVQQLADKGICSSML